MKIIAYYTQSSADPVLVFTRDSTDAARYAEEACRDRKFDSCVWVEIPLPDSLAKKLRSHVTPGTYKSPNFYMS